MILTKTNISNEAYFHNRIDYDVVSLPAAAATSGITQGGVGLVVQEILKG